MKKVKLLLIIALLGIVSISGAQNLTFNVKGGLNLSNLSDELNDTKAKPGLQIGVGADYEFAPNMAIQSGLLYSAKGAKFEKGTMNANFLQLPVHFAYKIDATPDTKIVLHAGPYIAYGIGGKWDDGYDKENTFDKDYGLIKRFDAGLGLGVGAEFGRIILDLGWDMGFINLAPDYKWDDKKIRTQNSYFSVGYKF